MIYKSCTKCGKVHPSNYQCRAGYKYIRTEDEASKVRQTYKWSQKSKEIRSKAKNLCEYCLKQGQITYKDIEVHHIESIRESGGLTFDDYNLISLCKEHHELAESGKIPKDELLELARAREESIPPGI